MKTLPIEKMIVADLKERFNNPKIKVNDILEWVTSEKLRDENLRDGEIGLASCGVYIAVKKELDLSSAKKNGR